MENLLIHPLQKKRDRTTVNNYRDTSLITIAYKIQFQCLLETVQQLKARIGEYQTEFRPGRSCSEQILNLKLILRHQRICNKNMVCTFVNLKKRLWINRSRITVSNTERTRLTHKNSDNHKTGTDRHKIQS